MASRPRRAAGLQGAAAARRPARTGRGDRCGRRRHVRAAPARHPRRDLAALRGRQGSLRARGLAPAPRWRHAAAATGPDPVRASRAVLRRVLADRAAVLTANAQEELSTSESIMGGQILSMLAMPLWRGDDIIGLIQADNRASTDMFTEPRSRGRAPARLRRRRSRSTTRRWSRGCGSPRSGRAARTSTSSASETEDQVRQHHRRLAGDEGGARRSSRR